MSRGKTIGKLVGEGLATLLENLDTDEQLDYAHLKNKPLDDTDVSKVKKLGLSDVDRLKLLSDDDVTKVKGLPADIAPNVKPDWNAPAGSDQEILNAPSIPTPEELYDIIQPTLATQIQRQVEASYTAVTAQRTLETSEVNLDANKVVITSDSIVLNQKTDVPSSYLDIRNTIGFRMKVVGRTSGARRVGPITGIGTFGSGGRMYFVDNTNKRVLAYNTEETRVQTEDFPLNSSGNYVGGFVLNDLFYVIVAGSGYSAQFRAYNFDGTRQASSDISVSWSGSETVRDVFLTSNRIYLVTSNKARAYAFDGTARTTEDIERGANAGTATENRIFLAAGSTVHVYDSDRNQQTAERFTIGISPKSAWCMNGSLYFLDDAKDIAIAYEPVTRLRDDTAKDLELTNVDHTGGLVAHSTKYHTISSIFTESSGTFQAGEEVDISFEYPAR